MAEILVPESNSQHTLSRNSAGRVIAGLAWDPNPSLGIIGTIRSMIMRYDEDNFDLDLSCYIYDNERKCIDYVTGEKDRIIDSSGGVRQDGDERDGKTQGDDEQIIIDLLALPREITSLIMLCEVASAHAFGNIHNPNARLADYGTNEDFLHTVPGHNNGHDKSACVFAVLKRVEENTWQADHISHYIDREDVEDDWPAYLAQFAE